MEILGTGIDISDISRLERAAKRTPGILERLFTETELGYCLRKRYPFEHLAGRFAAKEACIKALGRRIPWKSMEVRRGASGKPGMYVDPSYLPGGHAEIMVSLSHERAYAVASVVICAASSGEALVSL